MALWLHFLAVHGEEEEYKHMLYSSSLIVSDKNLIDIYVWAIFGANKYVQNKLSNSQVLFFYEHIVTNVVHV